MASDTKSDIIIGTETWLHEDIKNSELLLNDYDIQRRDRPTRGGGVLIAIKKSLSSELLSKSKNSESITCKIKLKGEKPLIISSVYRPPDYSIDESMEIIKEIRDVINKNKGAVSLVCGDFNLPDVDWVNQEIKGNKYLITMNENFLEMSHDLGMSQVVDLPTRGPSILDLCFTNFPHLITKCHLLAGMGDHEIVRIVTSIRPPRKKPIKREIQLWNKVDEEAIKRDVHNFKVKFLETFSASVYIIDIWEHIKSELNLIIKKHVPSKLNIFKISPALDKYHY